MEKKTSRALDYDWVSLLFHSSLIYSLSTRILNNNNCEGQLARREKNRDERREENNTRRDNNNNNNSSLVK